MKLGELLIRLGVTKAELKPGVSRDCTVILMAEESDGYNVKNVAYFQKEGQMWLTFDDSQSDWESTDETSEDILGPDDGESDEPMCERKGDMCALPEISGSCSNPFCDEGMTEMGPCLRCNTVKEEKQKIDICERSKQKRARQA